MDLLTVVEHELGHVLGLNDLDPQVAPHDLLTTTLAPGVRRFPMASVGLVAPAAMATPEAPPASSALPAPAAQPAGTAPVSPGMDSALANSFALLRADGALVWAATPGQSIGASGPALSLTAPVMAFDPGPGFSAPPGAAVGVAGSYGLAMTRAKPDDPGVDVGVLDQVFSSPDLWPEPWEALAGGVR
jgi:hypothetical protein